MVSSPDISNLPGNATIGDFFSLPNNTYPLFWGWIMGGIFLIITMTLYFKEKETAPKGNILSSMAISSLAVIFLSAIGTLVGFINLEMMIYILTFGMLIILIWFFSN